MKKRENRFGPKKMIPWKDHYPTIMKMIRDGITYDKIGATYGVSRQRINQVLKLYINNGKKVVLSKRRKVTEKVKL